jgi:hypothetical protein
MEWPKPFLTVIGLLGLSALPVNAQVLGPHWPEEPDLKLAAREQEPAPVRPAQTPADRPQVPTRPPTPGAAVPPTATPRPPQTTPGTPPPATVPPGTTPAQGGGLATGPNPALSAPIPPATPGPGTPLSSALPNVFGSNAPEFANLAGLRPSRTIEFLGDFGGASQLIPFARPAPPVPGKPPGIPGPQPPPNPGQGGGNRPSRGLILAPSIRGFKIAEDQSPRPIDRVYFFSNYFDDVNKAINTRLNAPVGSIIAYRNTFGFEKTFAEGRGSIGAQLPLNTLYVKSQVPGLGGTSTTVGDLSLILKYAFWQDNATGSLVSGGLAVTTPTGTDRFAGARGVTNFHYLGLQPYVGFIWSKDRLFFQGFGSISVPSNSRDVTFLFNDLGVGYYVHRDDDDKAFLSAVVPTFEVHVNTPLNHRGVNFGDPAGTPDIVDLTYGLNAFFKQRTRLAAAIVTPVTGPRPFSLEVLTQLTIRF